MAALLVILLTLLGAIWENTAATQPCSVVRTQITDLDNGVQRSLIGYPVEVRVTLRIGSLEQPTFIEQPVWFCTNRAARIFATNVSTATSVRLRTWPYQSAKFHPNLSTGQVWLICTCLTVLFATRYFYVIDIEPVDADRFEWDSPKQPAIWFWVGAALGSGHITTVTAIVCSLVGLNGWHAGSWGGFVVLLGWPVQVIVGGLMFAVFWLIEQAIPYRRNR